MLEEEYFNIMNELEDLSFRIPQTGIKFKYGNFIVESLYDISNELVYFVKKDIATHNIMTNHLAIYPKNNVGFTIRETNMNYRDIMEFINYIKKRKNSSFRKIGLNEGYIKELLINSEHICSICLDVCKDLHNLQIIDCGHAFHSNCIDNMINFKNVCPVCRQTFNINK